MKNFDAWNEQKKLLEEKIVGKLYHERDIWWCSLGLNVGYEQDGKNAKFLRPILIIKGLGKETCLIAPITASLNEHKYRIDIGMIPGKKSKVILSQIRVIDTKRLVEKIARLEETVFESIKKSLREFI